MSTVSLAEEEEAFPEEDVTSLVVPRGRYTPGWFYAIQLDPLGNPSKIKLGFSKNVPKRLKTYRTVYPYAKVIDYWDCRSITVEKDVLLLLEHGPGAWGRVAKTEIFEVFGSESHDINRFLDAVALTVDGVENQREGYVREDM